MHFFRNIKISSKLIVLVTVVIAFALIVSVIGIRSVLSISKKVEAGAYTITLPMEALNKVNFAYGQMMIQTHDLSQKSVSAGNDSPDAVAGATSADSVAGATAESDGEAPDGGWVLDMNTTTYAEMNMKDYIDAINEYQSILINHGITSGEEYDEIKTVIEISNTLLPMIQHWIDLSKQGELLQASDYMINEVKPQTDPLYRSLQKLNDINRIKSENILSDAHETRNKAIFTVVLAFIVGILIILPFVIMIIASITKPIREMSEIAAELVDGNIDIHVRADSRDEMNTLACGFNNVIKTLKGLITAMHDMASRQAAGDNEAVIDTQGYKGAYREVAEGINNMMTMSTQEQKEVLAVFSSFANGDFDAYIRKLPGKKSSVNEAVELFRRNLKDIYGEIRRLVSEASHGKLSVRTDTGKYTGDWVALMEELNNLLDEIIHPIDEASDVLSEMARGNFNVRVKGDYKGDMAIIKNSVNATVTAISSYITEITQVLGAISDDDLSMRINREYIGQFGNIKISLNKILEKLNGVISSISVSAGEVEKSAKHMSNGSAVAAEGAARQSSTIKQLVATIENIGAGIDQNAADAVHAGELSIASCEHAENSNREMQKMLSSMEDIKQSSDNISKILSVIQDIASQTNILAINASIEAARAGVHGQGFSIVADEVRNLANKSQQASNDIAVLVENSINKVSEGTIVADTANEAIRRITESINETERIVQNIANASNEQASAMESLRLGLSDISAVVQTDSALSEENLALSKELANQSEKLSKMTKTFKL